MNIFLWVSNPVKLQQVRRCLLEEFGNLEVAHSTFVDKDLQSCLAGIRPPLVFFQTAEGSHGEWKVLVRSADASTRRSLQRQMLRSDYEFVASVSTPEQVLNVLAEFAAQAVYFDYASSHFESPLRSKTLNLMEHAGKTYTLSHCVWSAAVNLMNETNPSPDLAQIEKTFQARYGQVPRSLGSLPPCWLPQLIPLLEQIQHAPWNRGYVPVIDSIRENAAVLEVTFQTTLETAPAGNRLTIADHARILLNERLYPTI